MSNSFSFSDSGWLIYQRGKSWFAKLVKTNSDVGPFSTFKEAQDFAWLREQ